MPTIVLQGTSAKSGGNSGSSKTSTYSVTASVSTAPGRYHYATVNGKLRTFELVGVDSSGNQVFRDQNRKG